MNGWQRWPKTDAVARELRSRGVGPDMAVGVLARNSRTFATAVLGASKVGADSVYLTPFFAGPQLADVSERVFERANHRHGACRRLCGDALIGARSTL